MTTNINKYGSYSISDKALKDIVAVAISYIKNVSPSKKDKDFVVCKFDKNNDLNIKVSIRVKKGIDIVKLCSKIQDEVKENILLMINIKCKKIDIDIQGFYEEKKG